MARSQYVDPYNDYQAQARADRSKERHERARQAVAANGGRSAPYSANDTTPSAMEARAQSSAASGGGTAMPLSADDVWRLKFPSPPTPQPFMSRPPLISARDSALMASGWQQPTQPKPMARPVMPDDMNNKAAMALYHQGMREYAARGTEPVGPPRLDARTMELLSPAARTLANNRSTPAPAFDQTTARAGLYARLPSVFEAGTPENLAFVQHAREFGEESAHRNIDDLLQQGGPVIDTTAEFVPNQPGAPAPIGSHIPEEEEPLSPAEQVARLLNPRA